MVNTIDFDPGVGVYTMASAGTGDVFITKLDQDGNFVWARSLGGTAYDKGNAITADVAGNVYTTSHFNGTADFDPGPGVFSQQGCIHFKAGNVYTTGFFKNTTDFDPGPGQFNMSHTVVSV